MRRVKVHEGKAGNHEVIEESVSVWSDTLNCVRIKWWETSRVLHFNVEMVFNFFKLVSVSSLQKLNAWGTPMIKRNVKERKSEHSSWFEIFEICECYEHANLNSLLFL